MKNVLSVAAVSLAVTAVFALSVTPAFAESSKKLTDDADIITSSQEETIENNLKKMYACHRLGHNNLYQ